MLLSEKPRARSVCCPGLWIGLGMRWVPWAHHSSAQQGEGAQCRARGFSKVLFGANLFQASYWCLVWDVSKGPCLLKELNGSCSAREKNWAAANEEQAVPCCSVKGLAQISPVLVCLRAHLRWVRHTQTREQLMAEGLPQMLLKPYATPPPPIWDGFPVPAVGASPSEGHGVPPAEGACVTSPAQPPRSNPPSKVSLSCLLL